MSPRDAGLFNVADARQRAHARVRVEHGRAREARARQHAARLAQEVFDFALGSLHAFEVARVPLVGRAYQELLVPRHDEEGAAVLRRFRIDGRVRAALERADDDVAALRPAYHLLARRAAEHFVNPGPRDVQYD